MRIRHIIASLDPAQGGPPVVAESLAKSQAALGHDVRLASEVLSVSAPVPAIQLPPHGMLDLWRRPSAAIEAVVADADVLHLHGIWEPVLPIVAGAARRAGRAYVITAHGMLDPWSLAQKKWKKKLALALGYREMLNGAAAIHALNEDEKALLSPLGLRTPCEVIPNGIFLDELDPPPDGQLFRRRQPGPGQRPYVLFLGRLHYKKGLDLLADCFAKLATKHSQIDLVVAGPDGGEQQSFRDRIEQLGLAGRVWLPGPLYGAEKWSALAGASVFCLPSRQEGFSVAILEAMACRVPVVISTNCHFPEVEQVGAGHVVPLDVAALADGLDTIVANPSAGTDMGLAGRALVEQRFTWPQVAKQTLSLYERLVKRAVAR